MDSRGKEGERGKIPSFETIKLADLAKYLKDNIKSDKKFVFLADMSGKAETFFHYTSEYDNYAFHGDVKSHIVHKEITKEKVSQNLRNRIISAMQIGTQIVIYFETTVPQMRENYENADILPL